MRLSALQRYILLECLNTKDFKLKRTKFGNFYDKREKKPKSDLVAKIVTRSLERLINKELMVGYGTRTPHKWFIKEVRLTTKGVKEARKLLGQQAKLPWRNKKLK